MAKVLLVDDEERFRTSLANRLRTRGFEVTDVDNGEDAVKRVRTDDGIDVAVIDLRMPGMDGIQTLKELHAFNPALQAVMLTGHGSLDSARDAGRQEAFRYLQKPCELEDLITVLTEARQEAVHAKARFEMAYQPAEKQSLWRWLIGSHNSRPLFLLIGAALFAGIVLAPPPDRLIELLGEGKSAQAVSAGVADPIMGYASYRDMRPGQTIAEFYGRKNGLEHQQVGPDGNSSTVPLSVAQAAFRAKAMLAILLVTALFWATGAIPVAVTTIFAAGALYLFDIFRPDGVAQALAKDAVLFIFGVLALSKAISKTGLDRRLGLLLLGPARNLTLFLLVFMPLFSVCCAIVSEHAMVAFTMPILVMVYASAIRTAGLKYDRALIVMMTLAVCYAANVGGPGTPSAGGRNAIAIGILADYGRPPNYLEWVKYGLPLVPVLSFCIGLYFLVALRRKTKVKHVNVAAEIKRAAAKIGPVTRNELITAGVLAAVVLLWMGESGPLGLGGPVLLGLLLLNMLRVLSWRDMQSIHWEVVALYAGACAIGAGLAQTGAALYMADAFVALLPAGMHTGTGLALASSLFSGLVTNFMSDGATVAAIGPVTVPMAVVAGVHPWMIGLATAFASSFAHMLIIGTPSNALAYAMAKDPNTGEQLVTLGDFLKHGFFVLLISFAVLWLWAILGYWQWLGFPNI